MDWLLWGGALGLAAAAGARRDVRQVAFQVRTRVPLPVGEQVFLAGSEDGLGLWKPDGFPLTRTDDNVWSGIALLAADEPVQYKITRGTWGTEEALEDGTVPDNRTLEPGGDQEVRLEVARWKDTSEGAPPQITGDFRIHEGFHSKYLRFDRRIIVWLPPSYQATPDRRYPVLYMHDGQQVFDPQTSTWKQDWEVDEWCTKLTVEGRLREIIVVAAYSTEDRFLEYSPSLAGREYARFMIEELKPFIDREYRTLPGRESTAVAGSSMGGTISFFLAWTRPDIYFGAACLSPAFRFRNDTFCLDLVGKSPAVPDLRLYLYCGLGDPTEEELAVGMREMAALLRARGISAGHSFTVVEDPPAKHNEAAWAKHTGEWLVFLFGA